MSLAFCQADHRYRSGQRLEVRWRVHLPNAATPPKPAAADQESDAKLTATIQGVETSVLWYTEGKGEEDFHVHDFQRLGPAELLTIDLTEPQVLATDLPATPLSFEGKLLRIRWCLRLRLFFDDGSETVAEHPFRLVAHVDANSEATAQLAGR